MKEKLMDLLDNKAELIFIVFNVSLGLLFWIGTYFTFLRDPMIINGKLSLSDLPGSFVFNLVIVASAIAFAYGKIENKNKLPKRMLLVQVIFATLFHFYGALLMRVGSDGSASGAFGRLFLFFILVIMWLNYFKPNLIYKLIEIIVPNNELVETQQEESME